MIDAASHPSSRPQLLLASAHLVPASSSPGDLRVDAAPGAIGRTMTRSRPLAKRMMPRPQLRMLDDIRRMADHARQDQLVIG